MVPQVTRRGALRMVGNTGTTPKQVPRFTTGQREYAIDAENVIHLSLSEGLDNNYPFGNSLLESIFKVYKQKELLEDAIIIYRTQRAPERRVFYIDVGNMPSHLAMQFVERVKTEIHPKTYSQVQVVQQMLLIVHTIPNRTNEDYFLPKQQKVEDLKLKHYQAVLT